MRTETGRKNIKWTDDEWNRLADTVFSLRLNNPADAITNLYSRAIAQFPENRRRPVQHAVITRLTELLVERGRKIKETADELARLRTKLDTGQVAPKENVLDNLSDEEVLRRFADRVLSKAPRKVLLEHLEIDDVVSEIPLPDLAAVTVKRLLSALHPEQSSPAEVIPALVHAAMPVPVLQEATEKRQRLPRVALVGFKPNQAQEVQKRFSKRAEFIMAAQDLSKKAIPSSTDIILHFARFSNHAVRDKLKKSGAKLLEVADGGVESVCTMLEKSLPR